MTTGYGDGNGSYRYIIVTSGITVHQSLEHRKWFQNVCTHRGRASSLSPGRVYFDQMFHSTSKVEKMKWVAKKKMFAPGSWTLIHCQTHSSCCLWVNWNIYIWSEYIFWLFCTSHCSGKTIKYLNSLRLSLLLLFTFKFFSIIPNRALRQKSTNYKKTYLLTKYCQVSTTK